MEGERRGTARDVFSGDLDPAGVADREWSFRHGVGWVRILEGLIECFLEGIELVYACKLQWT